MDIKHVVVLMRARRCGRLCRGSADRPPMMAIFGLPSTIRILRPTPCCPVSWPGASSAGSRPRRLTEGKCFQPQMDTNKHK